MILCVRACCYSVQRHAVKWWLLNCYKIWLRWNYNTAIFAWQLSPQYWEDTIHSNHITRMYFRIWTIRQLFCDFLQDLKVLHVHWSPKCFSFSPLHPTINPTNSFFQVYTYKREDFPHDFHAWWIYALKIELLVWGLKWPMLLLIVAISGPDFQSYL